MSKMRQQMQMQAQAEAEAAARPRTPAPKADPLDAKYDAANPYLKALKNSRDNPKLRAKADEWETNSAMWNEEAAKRLITE